MSVGFAISLVLAFVFSFLIEVHIFKNEDDWVTRLLRALGIYFGLITLVSYYTYLLRVPLDPAYFVIASAVPLTLLFKLSPKLGRIDWNFKHALPACIILLAGIFLFLVPSLPDMYPISWGVDANSHLAYVSNYISNIDSGKAVFYSRAYQYHPWLYPFSVHILAVVHILAIDANYINIVYPFVVFLLCLCAVALERIVYKATLDRILSTVAGLVLISSNYTYETLWGNGTYSQVLAQFLIILMVLELLYYFKKPSLVLLLPPALCAQTILFAHSYFAVIPQMIFLPLLLLCKLKTRDKVIHLAVFELVALFLATPYAIPVVMNVLGLSQDPVMGGDTMLLRDATVSHNVVYNLGLPLLAMLAVGVLYCIITRSYPLKDNWVLRIFMLCMVFILVGTWVASTYLGLGWYWHYKMFFLALYPFVLYAVLVILAVSSRLSSSLEHLLHVNPKLVMGGLVLAFSAFILFYPIASGESLIANCRNPDKVITSNQYAVLVQIRDSSEITKIAPLTSYVSAYYWELQISGKQRASTERIRYIFTSYRFCRESVIDPNAPVYLEELVNSTDNKTAIFVANYAITTGSSIGNRTEVRIGNVTMRVFAKSGEAVALVREN